MRRIKFDIGYYNTHPGCKVVTRDGKSVVRILCTDRRGTYPVVALLNNTWLEKFTSTGEVQEDDESYDDLFIEIESECIYKLGITFRADHIAHMDHVMHFSGHYTNIEDAKTDMELEKVANRSIHKIEIYCFHMESGSFARVNV